VTFFFVPCSEVRFEQAAADISLQRVQYIRQCAGLTPTPEPKTRPSILLVNRPYADGRTILGLDDVADRLRRALPDDVPIRIFLPRGDTGISNQAEAFDAANIVVAPHGAATANFNFLPLDAVALGVFALPGRWGHDEAVGASMPDPPYNITVWKVDCQAMTEARANAAGELPEFLALDAEDQVALLLGKEMNSERTKQVKGLLNMSLLDWMDYRSYAPDPVELTKQVLEAVAELEVKIAIREKNNSKNGI
jgi:Glycosyltransferase 61